MLTNRLAYSWETCSANIRLDIHTSIHFRESFFRLAWNMQVQTRESLLKGEAQCNWPAWTNYFRSANFDVANISYFLYKTTYLNEEVNRTEPSTSVNSLTVLHCVCVSVSVCVVPCFARKYLTRLLTNTLAYLLGASLVSQKKEKSFSA